MRLKRFTALLTLPDLCEANTVTFSRLNWLMRLRADFSDKGNNLDRKSWMRPQNTVFWDLDRRRIRSVKGNNLLNNINKRNNLYKSSRQVNNLYSKTWKIHFTQHKHQWKQAEFVLLTAMQQNLFYFYPNSQTSPNHVLRVRGRVVATAAKS
jgi:hypothetical protein